LAIADPSALPFWASAPCSWQQQRDKMQRLGRLRLELLKFDPASPCWRTLFEAIRELEAELGLSLTREPTTVAANGYDNSRARDDSDDD
jgi:hypothetical protein